MNTKHVEGTGTACIVECLFRLVEEIKKLHTKVNWQSDSNKARALLRRIRSTLTEFDNISVKHLRIAKDIDWVTVNAWQNQVSDLAGRVGK